MKLIDLSGKRFGRLTVIKRAGTYKSPKGATTPLWLCRCDCGNMVEVQGISLKSGNTVSCGCARSETHFNDYYIDGNTAHIICNNGEILIDAEDISIVANDRWYINKDGYGYSNKNKRLIHRILLNVRGDCVVDHINHNTLDNRKCNLRKVDYSVNGINKRLVPGISGEPYISQNKKSGYFSVYIDKKYRGGSYNLDEAIRMRNEALVGSKAEKYNAEAKCLSSSV